MNSVFFQARDLTLSYKRSHRRPGFFGYFRGPEREHVMAVNRASFTIERPGQALAVIGESGCGKTSVLKAIVGRVALPNNVGEFSGEVWFEGENLMTMSESELRKRIHWKKIAVVQQDTAASLNPSMRVGEHIRETLKVHAMANLNPVKRFGDQVLERLRIHDAPDMRAEVVQLLEDVELSEEFVDSYPHQLSGGQQQRVVIALALALRPPLVILDEPTSALDVSVQAGILTLLQRLKRERNLSYLLITHDLAIASMLCDLSAVFYAGRVVEFGPTDEVLQNPLHPYTQKLLNCIPQIGRETIESIPGEPPDLAHTAQGCAFAQRPAVRCGKCSDADTPKLRECGTGHFVACHGIAL